MEALHLWLTTPANELAEQATEDARSAERAMEKALKEHADAQTKLEVAQGAIRRVDSYRPKIGDDYQCPWCWIRENRLSILKSIEHEPGDSDTSSDLFKCRECHRVYVRPE